MFFIRILKTIFIADKAAHVPSSEGETSLNILTKVVEVKPAASVLPTVEPLASKRTTTDQVNMPISLLNFHSPSFEGFSLEDLRSVELDMSITKEEQLTVKKLTVTQSKSETSNKFISGRISDTTFKLAYNMSIENPSKAFIKRVCYPTKMLFEPPPIKYRKIHKSIARKAYVNYMNEKNHTNLKIEETGFIISLIHPELGANPDGIITCDCCGSGCLEIKCPFVLKDGTKSISEFAEMKSTCLTKEDNRYSLSKTHTYYFQVQLQMYVTNLTYCDFVIWSKAFFHIERIFYDAEFCAQKVAKALEFHKNVIIPEILGRWYTQQKSDRYENIQV